MANKTKGSTGDLQGWGDVQPSAPAPVKQAQTIAAAGSKSGAADTKPASNKSTGSSK